MFFTNIHFTTISIFSTNAKYHPSKLDCICTDEDLLCSVYWECQTSKLLSAGGSCMLGQTKKRSTLAIHHGELIIPPYCFAIFHCLRVVEGRLQCFLLYPVLPSALWRLHCSPTSRCLWSFQVMPSWFHRINTWHVFIFSSPRGTEKKLWSLP